VEAVDQPGGPKSPSLLDKHQYLERDLANKYMEDPKFVREGDIREDVIEYISSELGTVTNEILLTLPDDVDMLQALTGEVKEIQAVISGIRNKDWNPMQKHLQKRADAHKSASKVTGEQDNIGQGLEKLAKAIGALQPATPTGSPSLN